MGGTKPLSTENISLGWSAGAPDDCSGQSGHNYGWNVPPSGLKEAEESGLREEIEK